MLKNKVNYRYNTWRLKLNSICIYNFKSVIKATKYIYTNNIDFIVKNKVRYRYCIYLSRPKISFCINMIQNNILLFC